MPYPLHKTITYFAAHPRKLFLTDALGALLTAVLLWGPVRNQYTHFGLDPSVASGLALIASLLFIYSFSCYCFLKTAWTPFLSALAGINFFYCVLTLILICTQPGVKPLGIAYFTGELLIICLLVYIELRTARVLKTQRSIV